MGPLGSVKSLVAGAIVIALVAVGVAVYFWQRNAALERRLLEGDRAGGSSTSTDVRLLREGDEVPEFLSRDSEGREVKVAARGGKPALLLIYSPTCDRCETGMPAWIALNRQLKEIKAQVEVVAISVAPSYETVQHAREHKLPFAPVVFPDPELQKLYGVVEVPLTVVVDVHGRVEAVWSAPLDGGQVGDVIETVCPQCIEPESASGSPTREEVRK